ncbi:pitrilysin family protein [soil metagenome]
MRKLLRLIVSSVFSVVAASAAVAQPAAQVPPQRTPGGLVKVTSVEGIDEYRLANGLQVLLVPDDSKPTTTVNLTYRVGSRYENYGETGMAHLLEHMLFKGTPTHRQVWNDFSKRGLNANGSTSYDRTNYTAKFSANDDNLQWYIGWLADSMVNSFVARKDLDTEMTVVRNEMEKGENSPERILLQQTMAVMFDWHNYGKSTIGARADVENVDIPRLQAFYHQYYQPDNATLIVSGRFDPRRVLDWVAGSFGKIPKPTRKLPVQYTLDPAQDGERSVTLRRVGGTPLVFAGYHVPAAADPAAAAVEILAIVLGDTPSGRLHKRLTEAQLASSTFAFSWELAEPGVFMLGAELAPGQDVDKARDALIAVSESFAREPVTAEEIQRAKAKWAKGWEQAFTNPETVGISLSESIAQGDWRLFFLTRDRVRDVTLADVQRVATQYLLPSNRTLGTYLPTDAPVRAPAPVKVDVAKAMKDFKPEAAAAKVEAFEATPANIDARTQTFTVGGVKAAVLPKGTRGSAVRATLTLHFGDEKTLFGQGETADAVAALLDKGSKSMSREQVQDRLDALKTEIDIGGSPGQVTVTISSRREFLPGAIELIGELLRDPSLPPAALEELKRQSLTAIEQQRKEPGAVAGNTLARLGNPYPRGDVRYARTFDEMVADVDALSIANVRAFHSRFYGARQGEFGASGDMDVAAVKTALQKAFGNWNNAGEPYTRVPQPLVPVKAARLLLPTPDKQNATMLVQLPVPLSDGDADYPALMMANRILGSAGSSRLWKRIRETEGLSYDVRSGISWNSQEPNSEWQASAIFAPQNRAKVEAAFREELARALKDGFTAQELAEGQRGLLNLRQLSRAQDGSVAASLANNLYLGRTYAISAKVDAALAALTLDQVNAALRKYITPDAFVSAFAGDFK